jgi:hypothetical protein
VQSRKLVPDEILPGKVLKQIQAQYVAAVAEAENDYIHGKLGENSLTEALGAQLNLDDTVEGEDGRAYHLIAGYEKIIKRREATDAASGSRGIFQIEVSGSMGRIQRRMGLLFQAKTQWKGRDAELLDQARKLNGNFRRAIVIDYSPNGYGAASAAHVIAADGDRKRMRNRMRRLSDMLAIEFVHCRMGEMNLYWDSDNAILRDPSEHSESLSLDHVFSTRVRRLW